ncbi:vWA domain-containing protein [Treponema sp.]|uniref:vWA domain-containing protein n=1 Tax=Treponema sp. TaxID=166 RepID=UPI00298D7604|nr:vWA domain-containing protein [Treponema sp.]MCR5612597.1 VWA domain-containing protein [Treponema sp.]
MRESAKKNLMFLFLFTVTAVYSIFCQENKNYFIYPEDVRITEGSDGYHLFIRKKSGVESVMLTETTRDPTGQEPNYAYRAKEYNAVNGDEIRMLNGEKLDSVYARYSLVDSTVENDSVFGEAFHIFIPRQIVYGYPWSRNGTIEIGKGTFINIRSFEKKYCDYTGKYFDNPFMFDFEVIKRPRAKKNSIPEKKTAVVLTDDYNPIAAHTFKEISDFLIYSKGPETIVEDIMKSIQMIDPKDKADIVFAIDATGSMKDDIQKLKDEWVPSLLEGLKEFKDVRLGLLFYRDYNDNFFTRGLPVKYYDFTNDVNWFVKNLRAISIRGNEGGDIPEAVYEALYASMEFFEWRAGASKKVILIGDAEPHPTPRKSGRYSRELIEKISGEKGIVINAIITPDDKAKRGR